MLFWIIKVSITSLIFILIVHNIIQFLKETLTIPKVKDLVNIQNEKYQDIYNTINKHDTREIDIDIDIDINNSPPPSANISGTTDISSIPTTMNTENTENTLPKIKPDDAIDMKNELKSFMKKQLGTSNNHTMQSQPQFMPM